MASRIASAAAKPPSTGCPVEHHGFEPYSMEAPFTAYARLRSEAPVHFDERIDHWVVSRYADVKAVLEDWRTYSSENAQLPVRPLGPDAKEVLSRGGFTAYSGLSARVPPDHTRIRKAVTKAFTPRRYRVLEPRIRADVDAMLDVMVTRGARADVVADLARDLPAITLLNLLGVNGEMIPTVKQWALSRSLITWGDLSDAEQVTHAHNLVAYWKFCEELVSERHAAPGDDLISDLVRLQEQGDELSDHEIASFCWSMLFAGHETTTTLISNTLHELLRHPDQWNLLLTDPSRIPAAIDEVLRFSPSIVGWRRKSLQNGIVGGVEIPSGSNILLLLGSANRDEEVFREPETFDVTRENSRSHLSFGFGIHYCLGSLLAKQQTRIVVEAFIAKLPELRLTDGAIKFWDNISFRTPQSVPVEWDH
ncbi:cytochrome P450 [Streptomyces bobili]|uniref:cytochrome P450 n=1 Tax=Streptomyces bobili TaxID=67280 RepID=UPI00380EABC0